MPTTQNIGAFFGLAGVDPKENQRARKVAARLEWPMMIVALWIIVAWYLEASHHLSGTLIGLTDWLVWIFFLFETLIISCLVDNRIRYLRHNWINLVIIVFGFPLIWWFFPFTGALRTLRVLAMFGLFLQVSKSARKLLGRYNLGTTLALGLVTIVMAGFIVAGIDPAIDDPMDGIWWAMVTMTTVGYGDMVPTSTAGRLFASVLIVLGLALISVLTASFAAFFLSEEENQLRKKDKELLGRLKHLEKEVGEIKEMLETLTREPPKDR